LGLIFEKEGKVHKIFSLSGIYLLNLRLIIFLMRISLIVFVLLGLQSCTDSPVKQKNATIHVNNIDIVYDECGNADTTLLFVHGWCINKDYWGAQKNYFCDKYKVVALDLPGFGQSGKNRTEWTFDQYADDVNAFIKEKGFRNVILIGHSMSGDILLLMDTKYPKSIISIVGIDNLHKPGVKNTEQQTQGINSFFTQLDSNFSEEVELFAKENLFGSSTDTAVKNRVIRDFKANDPVIASKVLRSLVDVSQRESDLMQRLTHKLYLINVEGNPTQIDSLKKVCKASAEVVPVKGTSHYPMIERPAEFNAALEKVIRMISQ
jgi:pimeloyl-ACP methyl ester carboxylesterase